MPSISTTWRRNEVTIDTVKNGVTTPMNKQPVLWHGLVDTWFRWLPVQSPWLPVQLSLIERLQTEIC